MVDHQVELTHYHVQEPRFRSIAFTCTRKLYELWSSAAGVPPLPRVSLSLLPSLSLSLGLSPSVKKRGQWPPGMVKSYRYLVCTVARLVSRKEGGNNTCRLQYSFLLQLSDSLSEAIY